MSFAYLLNAVCNAICIKIPPRLGVRGLNQRISFIKRFCSIDTLIGLQKIVKDKPYNIINPDAYASAPIHGGSFYRDGNVMGVDYMFDYCIDHKSIIIGYPSMCLVKSIHPRLAGVYGCIVISC